MSLTRLYPQWRSLPEQKRALKSSVSWPQNSWVCRRRSCLEAILTREKWAVPASAMALRSAWQAGRRYAACRGVFVQLETPIALTPLITSLWICSSRCWFPADQTKTHLHTLSLVAKRLADKTICRRLRSAQKVMKSFIKLSLKQKAIRMRHNREGPSERLP